MKNYPVTKILCFFGSFNPPHLGHREIVGQALKNIPGVEKVLIIPANYHPKGKTLVSIRHRLKMLDLTFKGEDPRIEVAKINADKTLQGYTIDTLLEIKQKYQGEAGILLGADALDSFHHWKKRVGILQNCFTFIAPREELTQSQRMEALHPLLKPYLKKRLFFLPDNDKSSNISSTDVRKELKRNGFSKNLAQGVNEYIQSLRLYDTLR